jgi:hypothetical protein
MTVWCILDFGRHEGKSLPQILLSDPDYFFWAMEKKKFSPGSHLSAQANDLAFKARHIKIPKPDAENWRVKYIFHFQGKLCGFELIKEPPPADVCPDYLDLSIVRQLNEYDKLGNKLLLRDFKHYYFGCKNTRFTRDRCEEFFDNAANFASQPIKTSSDFRTLDDFIEIDDPSPIGEGCQSNYST